MITLRPAASRGFEERDWLRSYPSFSFAGFHDPDYMNFRALRVINEDYIAPGRGFDTHPHRDMEIITYVLEGAVSHRDTLGSEGITRAGEAQAMTAGRGIRHSEFNPADDTPLHLLQIWIVPNRTGLQPGYRQRAFSAIEKEGRLCLVVSVDGRRDSLAINQDVDLYASLLKTGQSVEHVLAPGRFGWLQVASGALRLNEVALGAGDGAAISDERRLEIAAESDAEFLLFDLN